MCHARHSAMQTCFRGKALALIFTLFFLCLVFVCLVLYLNACHKQLSRHHRYPMPLPVYKIRKNELAS